MDAIVRNMRDLLDGKPWYGRPLFNILDEIHPAVVFKKPNESAHSLIDLAYHMITWASFTLDRLKGIPVNDPDDSEELNWRQIDPLEHTWARALSELRALHEEIIELLQSKDDAILDKMVESRDYDHRHLLNGLIQHDIYHLGQIAYVKKWLIVD